MYKCGKEGRGNIGGVLQMMDKFGIEQVVYAEDPLWGPSCLHYAAEWRHLNIITLLIENGAVVDPREDHRETPLRWAIRYGAYSSITTLIKLGADLERAKDSNFWQKQFDESMREEKTKDAIKEGQRLAGENRK